MTCIRPYSYVVFAVTSPAPVASHAIEDPALVDTPENVLPPWMNRAGPCKVTVNGTPAIASPSRFTTFTEMEPLRKASASVRSTVVPAGVLPAD